MGNVFVATIMWKQMANICTFVCLNFCPNSSYTGEIILRHWGAGDLLSVSDGDVASVFKNCIFLHICCLYIWVSGGCEELYPHVTAGERERETVFKVAFFLLNVKRKLYLCAKWEEESRLQKGLCYCCCRSTLLRASRCRGALVTIAETPQGPHTHRHGENVLLFPGHPLNLLLLSFLWLS